MADPQHGATGGQRLLLQRAHPGEHGRELLGRVVPERRVLVGQPVAGRVGERDALRDDPAGCGGEQVAGPLGAQPVRQRELLRHLLRVDRVGDRGEQVDDDVRLRLRDGLLHGGGIEGVSGEGERSLDRTTGAAHRRDVVPGRGEQRDQTTADRSRATGDQDPHQQPTLAMSLFAPVDLIA